MMLNPARRKIRVRRPGRMRPLSFPHLPPSVLSKRPQKRRTKVTSPDFYDRRTICILIALTVTVSAAESFRIACAICILCALYQKYPCRKRLTTPDIFKVRRSRAAQPSIYICAGQMSVLLYYNVFFVHLDRKRKRRKPRRFPE